MELLFSEYSEPAELVSWSLLAEVLVITLGSTQYGHVTAYKFLVTFFLIDPNYPSKVY